MILNAARKIESLLQRQALLAGESREQPDYRITFEFPLGVAFWVSELDRVVAINAVWRID